MFHADACTFVCITDVLGHGTAVFEDLMVYLSSLEKMRARAGGKAYPGHGAPIDDCGSKITEYIAHRQQRENEVLQVLRYGSLDGLNAAAAAESAPADRNRAGWSPIELVKVIYKDVPESLHLPASHGVNQVLMKLEVDGKVTHDLHSGVWSISDQRAAL